MDLQELRQTLSSSGEPSGAPVNLHKVNPEPPQPQSPARAQTLQENSLRSPLLPLKSLLFPRLGCPKKPLREAPSSIWGALQEQGVEGILQNPWHGRLLPLPATRNNKCRCQGP